MSRYQKKHSPTTPIVIINHPYLLSPSTTTHGILRIQSPCSIVFFHNLSPSFLWSKCFARQQQILYVVNTKQGNLPQLFIDNSIGAICRAHAASAGYPLYHRKCHVADIALPIFITMCRLMGTAWKDTMQQLCTKCFQHVCCNKFLRQSNCCKYVQTHREWFSPNPYINTITQTCNHSENIKLIKNRDKIL